jgi:hypothetical protein
MLVKPPSDSGALSVRLIFTGDLGLLGCLAEQVALAVELEGDAAVSHADSFGGRLDDEALADVVGQG